MFLASAPQLEVERLNQLKKYRLTHDSFDEVFDEITALARRIFNVTYSAISFTEADYQRVVSHQGLALSLVPRDQAICAQTLFAQEHLFIGNLASDVRYRDHFLRYDYNVQTYLGVPIFSPDNVRIGSLCVMGEEAFTVSSREIEILKGLSRQITHQLKARLENIDRHEYREEMSESFSNSGIAFLKWSLTDGKVTYGLGSKSFLESAGDTERFQEFLLRIHPEDRKHFQDEASSLGDEKPVFKLSMRLQNSLGEWRWVLVRGWIRKGYQSEVSLSITDVNQEKSFEMELLENQQKMHALFEGSHDALTITSEDGRFFDCNSMALKLFGVKSRKEFSELHPSDLSPVYQPDGNMSYSKAMEHINKAFLTGSSRFEWIHRKLNGEEFPAEVMLSAFEFSGKRFLHASIRDIRRRKELELLNNSIQSLALIGAWELDVSSNSVRCTPQVLRIYGLQPGEADILTFDDGIKYYPPHEKERLESCISNCLLHGVSFEEEFEIVDSKGEEKWVRIFASPVRDMNGVIQIIKGTVQDITEKKLMQIEKDRKSDELLRFEEAINQNLSIVRMDREGKVTWVNDLYCERTRFLRSDIIGKNHFHYADNNEGERIEAAIWESVKGNKLWRGQKKLLRKDGSVYWVDSTVVPVFEKGVLKEVISFRLDITTQKKTSIIQTAVSGLRKKYIDCLGKKEEFFQYALQLFLEVSGSEMGFIGERLKNSQGKDFLKALAVTDISWNEESSARFKEGLIFSHPEALYAISFKSKKPYFTNRPETSFLPEGHPPLSSFLTLPITNYDQLLGFIGLANRKNGYSTEDIEYLEPLVNALGEMTNLLKIAEELQVQTRVSHHNSKLAMIGELAAGVGHEINNPLLIIQGFKNILYDELTKLEADEEMFEHLYNIDLATNRIASVVKGLRSFSRSDVDELGLFKMTDLILETTSMLRQIYKSENIELIEELQASGGYMVYGNRGRIQQVLFNLISNAKDATEGNLVRKILVKTEIVSDVLTVQVIDNGPGVPEYLSEKIFEPFFTTKEVHKGTGIGIPMSAAIIREHQGILDFENLDQGVNFKFQLPVIWADKEGIVERATSEFSRTLNCDVIVVDDEESICKILKFFLERNGARVRVFSNGEDALRGWEMNPTDLIISDLKMPVRNGVELLNAIRSSDKHNQPKFVLMSGGDQENLEISPTYDGILRKPFYPEYLCSFVHRILFGEAS